MSDILYYAPGSSTVIDHNFKQDQEIERLRSQLAEAEEELAQWRATGESVTRNEHDLAARLADIEAQNRVMWDVANDREARLAEAELSRDSWKREAELNQQAADESAEYARRLAEVEAGRDFLFASRDTERSAAALAIEELGARLVKAEALLKSARFAVAIAITYSVKPEAKDHYRKMLADTDAFLAR